MTTHQERFNRDKREVEEQMKKRLAAEGRSPSWPSGPRVGDVTEVPSAQGSLYDELLEVTDEAVARRHDPDTSHEAARSMTKERLTELKLAVLSIVVHHGPISQEHTCELYVKHHGPAAYSSVRTRFSELERLGYLKMVDRDGKTKGGRACNRYIGSQDPCWALEADQPDYAQPDYESAYKALREGLTGIVLDERNSLRDSLRHHLADLLFQTSPESGR